MLELGVKFLISYFIGSLMGAIIVGKLRGGVDIRTMGSGNAGGTNALRSVGFTFALGVVIIDVGKGALAAGWVPGLVGAMQDHVPLWCGFAAVFGHCYPVWHGFRGGKGAATLIGTFIVLGPELILPIILVWAWVLVMSGYVGLSTMIAASSVPVWLGITRLPEDQPLFIYSAIMALYVIRWHRSNIQRMREGAEHRNTRVMLFSGHRGAANDERS